MIELGARFSNQTVRTDIFQEEDAKLEIIQGELLPQFAGKDYEDILQYLNEEKYFKLPPLIQRKLDLLLKKRNNY